LVPAMRSGSEWMLPSHHHCRHRHMQTARSRRRRKARRRARDELDFPYDQISMRN
jgi:hypothetical protein